MQDFIISRDKSLLDFKLVHQFLTNSYWAKNRTFEQVKKSIENSFCYGVYVSGKQIGFARVISDLSTFAYLMDVFIIEEFRGKGYSKVLLKKIIDDQQFSDVKKWMLATKDAHSLYKKFGFEVMTNSSKYMEKINVNIK